MLLWRGFAVIFLAFAAVEIRIDKRSDVPVREQIREQIVYLISTGRMEVGAELPSVRQLARRLKVHHNTISHVYSKLVKDGWLAERRGSRLTVVEKAAIQNGREVRDLDDLINRTIEVARQHGYSLQQLTTRLRQRLMAEPPDHLLVVAPRQLGELIRHEIYEALRILPPACSIAMLQHNPGITIGAALVIPGYLVHELEQLPPGGRTIIPIEYSPADEHVEAIRNLPHPSVIGVASVSTAFLKTASGLLAPAIGRRHSLKEFLVERNETTERVSEFDPSEYTSHMTEEWAVPEPQAEGGSLMFLSTDKDAERGRVLPVDLGALDVLFCDSITYPALKHRRRVRYRLLSEESLAGIRAVAEMIAPRRG